MAKNKTTKKRQKEGRRVKSLSPMSYVSPYIMKTRGDASNYIQDTMPTAAADDYIFKKRREGLKGFGMLHLFIASYVRTVSQYPGVNRFIRGQKIYSRNCIEIMITIKREMKLNCPDTVLKLYFPPDATAEEVYHIIDNTVKESRAEESNFDGLAKLLHFIPGLLLKFVVWLLNLFDYFGWLPRKLTKLSPFHASMAITNMASLGIPPIYHHLYNFGNIPVFCAFGAKYTVNELSEDGTIVPVKYLDYKFVTDERICDGHYYANVLKYVRSVLTHPEQLDSRPDKVINDVP